MAFAALEPFGPLADDLRHGLLCATIIAPHLKKGAVADPHNYMLRPPGVPELSSEKTEQMLDFLLGVRAPKQD